MSHSHGGTASFILLWRVEPFSLPADVTHLVPPGPTRFLRHGFTWDVRVAKKKYRGAHSTPKVNANICHCIFLWERRESWRGGAVLAWAGSGRRWMTHHRLTSIQSLCAELSVLLVLKSPFWVQHSSLIFLRAKHPSASSIRTHGYNARRKWMLVQLIFYKQSTSI